MRDYASWREEMRERAREPTPRPRTEERRERSRSRARENDNLPIVHTISGGFEEGEESSSARKAYARQLDDFEVYSVQKLPKGWRCDLIVVGFSDEDYARVSLPHTDALVVSLTIANQHIQRVLIDTGSSADILFKSVFDHMSIPRGRVALVVCHLLGFAGEMVLPLGSIELPITAGTYLR
jgi:hypothetical protein